MQNNWSSNTWRAKQSIAGVCLIKRQDSEEVACAFFPPTLGISNFCPGIANAVQCVTLNCLITMIIMNLVKIHKVVNFVKTSQ